MKASAWLVAAAIMLVLAACGGQVVQTEYVHEIPGTFDGAFVSYFQPRGLFTVTATYKAKDDSVALEYGIKIVPDVRRRYYAVYRHSEMSSDDVQIDVDSNGLLKLISTTTEDQTLALAKGVGEVIKQVSSLQKAPAKAEAEEKALAEPKPPCPADTIIVVKATVDLTDGPDSPFNQNPGSRRVEQCNFTVDVDVPQFAGFRGKGRDKAPWVVLPDPTCPTSAVCFRISEGFEFAIRTSIAKAGKPSDFPDEQVSVVAPVHRMGVLYFNRRAFVKNTTTATFTNGMLTSLKVKDPSSLVEFLSLPVEVLKSVAILVKL